MKRWYEVEVSEKVIRGYHVLAETPEEAEDLAHMGHTVKGVCVKVADVSGAIETVGCTLIPYRLLSDRERYFWDMATVSD